MITVFNQKIFQWLEGITDKVARKTFRDRFPDGQQMILGYDWTDLSAELMLYAFDDAAQRRKGLKITDGSDDPEVASVFTKVAKDWFNAVADQRDAQVGHGLMLPVATAEPQRPVSEAWRLYDETVDEAGVSVWDDADGVNYLVEAAQAKTDLKRRLKAANSPIMPPNEAVRWLARAFKADPDDREFAGCRRILARALSALRDTREKDVALLTSVFVNGHTPKGNTERKNLSRAVEHVVRLVNRELKGARRDILSPGGPGDRQAMSNEGARGVTSREWSGEALRHDQ